jgi:predicted tellurium resistance membrane protein TerC
MIAAIAISVVVMLIFSKAIVGFIERHPALKILALSFLLLIGTLLVAEGFHQKIPKGYVYFAMAFCLGVELLQIRAIKPAARDTSPSL